jgi:hypothetical protein
MCDREREAIFMNKANGLYIGLGTGTMRVGLGFVPRKVKIVQIGTANLVTLDWNQSMARSATGAGGIIRAGVSNTPGFALLAANAGVRAYFGGDAVASSTLANQVAVSIVPSYAGTRQGTIKEWALGSSANRTGSFDAGLDTDKSGVGSLVEVRAADQKIYKAYIVALTNDGDAANEVTLDRSVPPGVVTFIGAKVDYVAAPAGIHMPAGFEVLDTTYANVASTVFAFEAED